MTEMTEARAREILGTAIQDSGSLLHAGMLEWRTNSDRVFIDRGFTADELEAIVFWMRKHAP